jgi:hypothetical protein
MLRFSLIAGLVILTGCSTGKYYSYPPGGTDVQFQRDSYECMQEAQQSASSAYVGPYGGAANSGTTTNAALAHACMRARGYVETSPPKR